MQISPGTPAPAASLSLFLPAIVTLLVGAAATTIQWLDRLSRDTKRLQRWADANSAVEYWGAHLKVLENILGPTDDRLQAEKQLACNALIQVSVWVARDLRAPVIITPLPHASRPISQFLLLLPASRHKGRIFLATRAVFWLLILYFAVRLSHLAWIEIYHPELVYPTGQHPFNLSTATLNLLLAILAGFSIYLFRLVAYDIWARMVRSRREDIARKRPRNQAK